MFRELYFLLKKTNFNFRNIYKFSLEIAMDILFAFCKLKNLSKKKKNK